MIGIFSKTTDSNIIEAAGLSGLDFIILDQEHGLVDRERLHNHIRASHQSNMKAIVRVAELNHNLIGSALDAGADGVQIPNISTAEDAKNAIEDARFYPMGKRGVCRFVKAASFGEKNKIEYFNDENKKFLILQIEGQEGIKNIDEILRIDGYDILFIGPYDLSQSLGIPGQINHPKIIEQIKIIRKKALENNKKLGTFVDDIENAIHYKNQGFYYIAHSVDINMFLNTCKELKNKVENG
ncbi:MAG: aldolase/citrate lyase family protein [Chitinophagales bacterium]|nr:aldolase/citrate lyase family protein [Chitinophagales bacterium]